MCASGLTFKSKAFNAICAGIAYAVVNVKAEDCYIANVTINTRTVIGCIQFVSIL